MTDDIVTRLRVLLSKCCIAPAMVVWSRELRDAADEIERLRRERDELQQWKDAHNTFWRDRAERRDAMREGEKNR